MIEAIVSMLMRLQDEENTDLPMYEKQLRQTETAIDNIVTAVMNGMASKALQAKLTELEETKEELLVRIEEEKLEKPKISAEFMTFWLHRFRKLDVTNVQHRRMLIDTFVNAVFLYDDKLLLTYNFKDGTRTITFNDVKTAANKAGSDLDCLGAPKKHDGFDTKPSCFFLYWLIFTQQFDTIYSTNLNLGYRLSAATRQIVV